VPFIQAASYSLSSQRGVGSANVFNRRRITPLAFVGSGNGIDFVDITYNATQLFPVGEIPPATPRRVFGFFAPEDFDIHRLIFQTEAPVEIEWQTDPNNASSLTSLTVRTREEPPGEGPSDIS
jgi:hypothetical protein